MSEEIKKWRYGRDTLKGDEVIVNGVIQEKEVVQPPEVNPHLCAMRRKREFERDMKACDFSLEALEI